VCRRVSMSACMDIPSASEAAGCMLKRVPEREGGPGELSSTALDSRIRCRVLQVQHSPCDWQSSWVFTVVRQRGSVLQHSNIGSADWLLCANVQYCVL